MTTPELPEEPEYLAAIISATPDPDEDPDAAPVVAVGQTPLPPTFTRSPVTTTTAPIPPSIPVTPPAVASVAAAAATDADFRASVLRALAAINIHLERLVVALERPTATAAVAVPQTATAVVPWPQAGQATTAPAGPTPAQLAWLCPIHGQQKVVPGGFSTRTQKNYPPFVACPVQGCQQKPPRG